MYVAAIQRLNCRGQESKTLNCSLYFWHTCDLETKSISLNLNDDVGPKQCHIHAKFERS